MVCYNFMDLCVIMFSFLPESMKLLEAKDDNMFYKRRYFTQFITKYRMNFLVFLSTAMETNIRKHYRIAKTPIVYITLLRRKQRRKFAKFAFYTASYIDKQ